MSRSRAIGRVRAYFDDGGFVEDLGRRVAFPTTCQEPGREGAIRAYLADEIGPVLERLGYRARIVENPVAGGPPFLIADRTEDPDLVTVLTYGHGDTIRGMDGEWRDGRSPWVLTRDGDRLYGRGTADNKGQHSINIGALAAVVAERGRLGFNSKLLIEMGEEVGSLGMPELCERERDGLLAADILIASDGPRVAPERPTMFLGARGIILFEIAVDLREGGHHSGNWGGLLANPGHILAHALASITDARGAILVPELRPPLPDSVRRALAGVTVDSGERGPAINRDWGEPGLTPAERVYAWNSLDVLAFTTGNPDHPVNAIPPRARAFCQLRFVVGTDPDQVVPALRRHLQARGFRDVTVRQADYGFFGASRLDPDDPWVQWAKASFERTTGEAPTIIPSIGGSLPNNLFSDVLGLKTIWVPHSYLGCSQHSPNEHLLASTARQGLEIMTGLFWDLGEPSTPAVAGRHG